MRGALAVVLVMALAACGSAPPEPLTGERRIEIRQTMIDVAWDKVEYAEALRPVLPAEETLADVDWSASVIDCLGDGGYRVQQQGYEFAYSSSQGQSPVDFAVSTYICTIKHPRLGELMMYLDVDQRGALWDYLVRVVRPCLLLEGVEVSAPPGRADYAEGLYRTNWHPFDLLWASEPTAGVLARVESACRPVPAWLHL